MFDSFVACVSDVRQWEYISYCLSQLTYTEKGLKKLIDNFKMFEHALSEDSVMNHFRSVIAKVGCIAWMAAYASYFVEQRSNL
jgi:condensin complex subunit 1